MKNLLLLILFASINSVVFAQESVTVDKGNGYAGLKIFSDGDGTGNNNTITIGAYGYGGSSDLNFRNGNWGGSYYFKRGASDGTFNQVRIGHGGGGSNGYQTGYGVFDIYGTGDVVGTRISGGGHSYFLNGNVGIGTNQPASKLEIVNKGDGAELLRFSTERPWVFRQTSSGGTSQLDLHSTIEEKYFKITSKNDTRVAQFYASDEDKGSRVFLVPDGGKIGIGTSSPLTNLDVRTSDQSGVIATFLSDKGIPDGSEVHRWAIRTGRSYDYPNRTLDFGMVSDQHGSNPAFYVAPKGVEAFRITEDGIVGIGTSDPDPNFMLSVNGPIRTKEVEVQADWSDFVFYDDYELRTLEEVENYIEENKHLPDIPSEAEVAKNGIKVGEMNAKLLQKVEELTLYLIEQNKQLDVANKNINDLRREISALNKQ